MLSMIIGMSYVIFLTVSLFLKPIEEPVAVIVAELIVFQGDIGDELIENTKSWTIIIYKITAFMSAICFLLLASYIAYYKSVVKVDAL